MPPEGIIRRYYQPTPRRSPLWDYLLTALVAALAIAIGAAASGAMVGPIILIVVPLIVGLLGLVGILRRLVLGIATLFAVLLIVALTTPALRPAVANLVEAQAPTKADAIVILGGGYNCSTRSLASSSLSRLVRGLQLWRAGYAPTITLSETPPELFGQDCGSIAPTADYLTTRLLGQDRPKVEYLRDVRTTRTEALAAAKLAEEKGWTHVLLVTGATHTRRAAATFRKAGLNVTPVAAEYTDFDPTLPWPSDRWAALSTLTREYLGLITYRLNGWL